MRGPLANLADAISLYGRYIAISLRAQLQYPASFLVMTLGQLLGTGIEFLGMWALFDRFGHLGGWRLAEVAFFYGIADVTFAIADALAHGFDSFGNLIKSGDFDRILLRPRSAVLQLLGQELTLKRIGRLAQGSAILAWASASAGVDWSPPLAALLVAAIAGGVCLFLGLTILQATSAFWTVETLEIWNAFTYGGTYTAQYPLSIYRPWWRRFFTFVVPLACVNYLPALRLLDRPDPLGLPPLAGWFSPLAGLAFLLFSLLVWRRGVHHYLSTGS
jgi:viologen exporter family transport system permease protein